MCVYIYVHTCIHTYIHRNTSSVCLVRGGDGSGALLKLHVFYQEYYIYVLDLFVSYYYPPYPQQTHTHAVSLSLLDSLITLQSVFLIP